MVTKSTSIHREMTKRPIFKITGIFSEKAFISATSIGRFQAIKTDVLLIFSSITGDKTEFLSPMMFSNEYITGI